MERKFEVGDRVIRIEKGAIRVSVGDIGVIKQISRDGENLYIKGINGGYLSSRFKHYRIRDTKIARKVRANDIDKIEKGWIYLK